MPQKRFGRILWFSLAVLVLGLIVGGVGLILFDGATSGSRRPAPVYALDRAAEVATPRPSPSPIQTATAGKKTKKVAPLKSLNYLRASGSKILDARGQQVRLTGVNWFGMETGTFAPHGLWARKWDDMLDQVVELGFNAIRLPFTNEMFDAGSVPNGINWDLNPVLKGLSPLDIMDTIVVGAGERGLKVILDRHRPGSDSQSSLWYTGRYGEERWIKDWTMLAARYAGNDAVVGVDLHNEPKGEATWGSGNRDNDWRLAAERAGNEILRVNPNLLIIVEGVDNFKGNWYWWGGNLMGAKEFPVRLNLPGRLVYSPHDYGPGVYVQNWFTDKSFPANLPKIWQDNWFYIAKEGIAPVFVGEFGGRSVGNDTEGTWQRSLTRFLKENSVSYTYWSLNPNSGDTGGMLADDWLTPIAGKVALLSEYQAPLLGNGSPTTVTGKR